MHKHLALAMVMLAAACTNELALDEPLASEALTSYVSVPPTMVYSRTRPLEDQTYSQLPLLTFHVTDPASVSALSGRLFTNCQIELQPLAQASGTPTMITSTCLVAPIAVPIGSPPPPPATSRNVSVNINAPTRNLRAIAPYRVRFTLLDDTGAAIGVASSWGYSTTGNPTTSPSTTLQLGRIDMALLAFVQLGDAEAGLIGPGGTVAPDGTRFVSTAHPSYHVGDELTGWCDWFYRYLGVIVTDGLDGNLATDPVAFGGNAYWGATMNPNNVPNAFRDPVDDGCGTEKATDVDGNGSVGLIQDGCQNYSSADVSLDSDDNEFFSNISGNIYYYFSKSLPMNQAMGNYQAMDRHAGMFLDFDPNGNGTKTGSGTTGTVWSIEGNVSDTVKVMTRVPTDTTINGYGKLDLAMFQ